MTPAELERVKRIFLAAKKRPPEERAGFVASSCADMPEIGAEVLALLSAVPVADPVDDEVWDGAENQELGLTPGSGAPRSSPQTRGHFDRFRILSSLGVGGMGTVDLAFDSRLDREVALKRVHPEMLRSATALARFKREALAASRLDHPGLCPVYEVGESEGTPYYVMPVIDGQSLAAILDGEATQLDESGRIDLGVRITRDVARALDHAHRAGLVHRDIKPANIMIQSDGAPIVLDFGLVQDAAAEGEQLTETGQQPGTPFYMSPEQVRATPGPADGRTDIYALGVMLYECVTLQRPFTADTQYELFDQIRHQVPLSPHRINRQVSRDLCVVIDVAMDKDPLRRYQTAQEFADDLHAIRIGQPIRARGASWSVRLQRWVGRNPQAAVAFLILVVALIGSGFLWSDSAAIAEQMSVVESQERGDRDRAVKNHELAQATLREFDSLAVRVRLDDARRVANELYPAWPEKTRSLEAWLLQHAAPLVADLDRVREVLRGLESTGELVELSVAEREDLAEERRNLQKMIAAIERTLSVRSGRTKLVPVSIPASAPRDSKALVDLAWPLVAPGRPAKSYGQEALGLAYAARAMEITSKDPVAAYVYVCGAFATGLDQGRGATDFLAGAEGVAPDGQLLSELAKRTVDELEAAHDRLAAARLRCESIGNRLDQPELRFRNRSRRFLYESLREVESELVEFCGEAGLRRDVERRLPWSKQVWDLTTSHPNARVSWAQAAAAVAAADGVIASKLYASSAIKLRPQTGLVPIGMNPVTKLWEFYHLRSAIDPRRGGRGEKLTLPIHREDGRLDLTPEMGIVFVLMPGGVMPDREIPPLGTVEAERFARDLPEGQSDFAPFFISKYELTQGQWIRLSMMENPSRLRPGVGAGRSVFSLLHPVETVSWAEFDVLFRRHGLGIPTEWEWEYAARGGVKKQWLFDVSRKRLAGLVNTLDASARGSGLHTTELSEAPDGYPYHAPVGTFPANVFGLCEVMGNVREWCRNEWEPGAMVIRGGSYARSLDRARLSYRASDPPTSKAMDVGVRPIRSLR